MIDNNGIKNEAVKPARCVCKKTDGLFVPNRHLSGIVASGVAVMFFTFIIGFFGGQRYVVQSFSDKVTQGSFGDQMYASICSFTDQDVDIVAEQEDECSQDEQGVPHKLMVNNSWSQGASNHKIASESQRPTSSVTQYYAQLVGFGTLRAAQRCARRLLDKGFSVDVNVKKSKTSRGKIISWYQLVTHLYEDKEKLQNIVDRITQQEKLKGVHITAVG